MGNWGSTPISRSRSRRWRAPQRQVQPTEAPSVAQADTVPPRRLARAWGGQMRRDVKQTGCSRPSSVRSECWLPARQATHPQAHRNTKAQVSEGSSRNGPLITNLHLREQLIASTTTLNACLCQFSHPLILSLYAAFLSLEGIYTMTLNKEFC